jgi:soluble lytic murein transglycosylase-like protein
MNSMVIVTLVLSSLFSQIIERAFTLVQNRDWPAAAAALDEAAADDSALFAANNLSYLRGRIAETSSDWSRAREEFLKIPQGHSLRPLAAWHAAMVSLQLKDDATAESLFAELPTDFPPDLKMQFARMAPPDLALKAFSTLPSREARFERAKMLDDKSALWSLIHDRKDDDVGLQSAHLLSHVAAGSRELIEVADTFVAHRQFEYAQPLYETASAQDPKVAAESRFQIARIQFLREDYHSAVDTYKAISQDFPGSSWDKDAQYQVASCYWRLGEFKSAEQTYLAFLKRYGLSEDGAIRNLVDVYRVMDENAKALVWVDKGLAQRLSVGTRQVFLFSKAKILFTQKRYASATLLFRQLGRSTVRSAPGGTTKDEARYFEALSLSKSGNNAAAKTIWRSLAKDPYSYYGARADEKLGSAKPVAPQEACTDTPDAVFASSQTDLQVTRHAIRSSADEPPADAVSELLFLQLWDEAFLLKERASGRPEYKAASELAYVAGRYHRAINYADHLPSSDPDAMGLSYPLGFHDLICQQATKYDFDPLWLHAIIWQESKYNPYARSGASARGLMQFIPETANAVGAALGINEFSLDRLYDPNVNIPMGAHYWDSLLKEFKNPLLALAAYNGGPENVRRWKSKWPAGDDDFFVADIGFVETKKYVMAVYGARAAYGQLIGNNR